MQGGNGFMSPQNQGGGGFMSPSSFKQQDENGGFKQDSSPNSKRMLRDKKSLRPVTVSQLNSVQAKQDGEGFMLDGIDLDQVKLLGCITNIEEGTAHLNITIHDGFEETVVKRWSDGEQTEHEAKNLAQLQVGTFVQVVGQLKSLGQSRQMQTFNIRPIKDYNDIVQHTLDSVYATLVLTQSPLEPPKMEGSQPQKTGLSQSGTFGAKFNQQNAPSVHNPVTQQQDSGENPNRNRVLDLFRELGDPEEGASIIDVQARMESDYGVKKDEVRKIVDTLFYEGQVFSTIDENTHYQVTE